MSRDADTNNMLTVLTPLNTSYRKALENEGMINLTSSFEMDVWIMPNPPSTSTLKVTMVTKIPSLIKYCVVIN